MTGSWKTFITSLHPEVEVDVEEFEDGDNDDEEEDDDDDFDDGCRGGGCRGLGREKIEKQNEKIGAKREREKKIKFFNKWK